MAVAKQPMTKEIVIVGAGRQGRNALEIFNLGPDKYPVAGFVDDTKEPNEIVIGRPVLGGFARIDDAEFVQRHAWFVALGNNPVRLEIGRRLQAAGGTIVNAIHPSSDISSFSEIGIGVFAAAFVRVASYSRIGDWALVESFCVIGCDSVLGAGASLGPNCVLTGGSTVGDLTFVGTGAVVANNIRVGSNCIIGANAAVVRHVPDGERAQGVPARVVERSKR
jgi:UDP-perosamine 4-acetyltransferase